MSEQKKNIPIFRPPLQAAKRTVQHIICAVILEVSPPWSSDSFTGTIHWSEMIWTESIPERLSVSPVLSHGPSLKIVSEEHGISVCRDKCTVPDVDIRFKDLGFAFSVLTGRTGIAESFSKHMMYVNGDFSKIMSLVRCMEQAERYLFPPFITRRILKSLLPKSISSLHLYISILRSMIIR